MRRASKWGGLKVDTGVYGILKLNVRVHCRVSLYCDSVSNGISKALHEKVFSRSLRELKYIDHVSNELCFSSC